MGGIISNDMLEGAMAGKTLEGDLVKVMQHGEAYVNVHTTENPNGAIRGQITPGGTQLIPYRLFIYLFFCVLFHVNSLILLS